MQFIMLSALMRLALGADLIGYTYPSNGQFGTFSEGAGLDAEGNLYPVNYFRTGANVSLASHIIGKVNTETGRVVEGIVLPGGQDHLYNGVDFGRFGTAFVADAKRNKVYRVTRLERWLGFGISLGVCDLKPAIGNTGILAPNDVVMSYDGNTAFVSGMNYNENLGLVAKCDIASGKVDVLYRGLRTNGIEIAPTQDKLFFTEGGAKEEWINVMDLRTHKVKLVYNFTRAELPSTSDLDGMRLDIDGFLYVTMGGSSKVAIVDTRSNKLETLVDIPLMSNPTNLAVNARNVFVVGHNKGVVTSTYKFPANAPGARHRNLCLGIL